MKPTDFAARLTAFLSQYLPAQKNVSPNTVKAYRDAFTLLLRYCRDEKKVPPEKVTLDTLNVSLVLSFLNHLETGGNCGTRTRNHRLSVLHAFFRYLQIETPERMVQCQQILAIPFQRCSRPTVNYLSIGELSEILSQPDLTTNHGRRDAVMLSVLYDTGARVQELVDLTVRDVRLDSPAQIRLTGKGRKTRVIPLLSGTVDLLAQYMREHRLDSPERTDSPLFFNRQGEHLSRSGVRYLLMKYTENARKVKPGLPDKISPHTLRHSKAMHLLQAGNPATVIQAILGHADIRSTDIYARADMEMKRRALERATKIVPSGGLPSWQCDKGLMDWLRSL
jgi:site-specific recombinase XerD